MSDISEKLWPPPGLVRLLMRVPRLALWTAFFRRFAAAQAQDCFEHNSL